MTVTTIFAIIVVVVILAAVIAAAICLDRIDAKRQQAVYEAQLRTFHIQQVEFDTEQRLRNATRDHMNKMLAEVRRHSQP